MDPESDPSWFFNHCCEGNTHYDGDKRVVARRRIPAGEECTYDYALTETEASFHAGMHCKCGAASCRGLLRFDDYRQALFLVYEGDDCMLQFCVLRALQSSGRSGNGDGSDCAMNGVPLVPALLLQPHQKVACCRKPEFWAKYGGHTTSHIARRAQECGWLDSRLAVRRAATHDADGRDRQHGVFALCHVPRGEVIAVFGGKTVGKQDAAALEAATPGGYPYLLQVAADLWQVPHCPDAPDAPDFINHSCEANCGMADSTQVVTIRDVAPGEEVTLDYSLINDGASPWSSDNIPVCGCGARSCRRKVTSRDWQLPGVQERYWPHFSPFVRRLVAARRPDLAAPWGGFKLGGGMAAGRSPATTPVVEACC